MAAYSSFPDLLLQLLDFQLIRFVSFLVRLVGLFQFLYLVVQLLNSILQSFKFFIAHFRRRPIREGDGPSRLLLALRRFWNAFSFVIGHLFCSSLSCRRSPGGT